MAMDLSQKHYRENGTLERVVGGGGAVEHYDILGKFVERIESVTGSGEPIVFYTSRGIDNERPFQQWAALGDADEDVVTALKAWRLERARGDGVPAYVVMNDRTLAEVATTLPRTLDDLLGVSGIGPSKLERYGDEVLAVVDGVRPA